MSENTLRHVLTSLPPDALLPVRWLLDQLNGDASEPVSTAPADFTVAQLAERFHRSPSTIRGWCEAGRFTGAYRLNGRDWRVPDGAVVAFLEAQKGRSSGLGNWRKVRSP